MRSSSLLRLLVVVCTFLAPIVAAQTGPTITAQPQNANVAVGGSASFTVTASASGTITYQWKYQSSPITGATSATLTLSPSEKTMNGEYSVDVTAGGTTVTSRRALLRVMTSPSIVAQPTEHYVAIGQFFAISVSAEGDNLTYEWKKDGAVLTRSESYNGYSATAEANSTGDYVCVVSSPIGSVTSAPIHVTAYDSAAATVISPGDQLVEPGTAVTLSVPAIGTPGQLQYVWYHDDRMVTGVSGPVLSLPEVSALDAGTYWVVLGYQGGQVDITRVPVRIDVKAPPALRNQPQSCELPFGREWFEYLVAVSGTGPFTFQWYKDGVPLARSATYLIDIGSYFTYLTFRQATAEIAGTYTLVVSNTYGSSTSAPARITILGAPPEPPLAPPVITEQPIGGSVNSGATLVLSAQATGEGLTYQWHKDGLPVPGGNDRVLTLVNVQRQDAGTYKLLVSNAAGSVFSREVAVGVVDTRLSNLSSRAQVGTDADILIAGFVIGGSGEKTLLLRAVGPTLAEYSVNGPLANPQLTLLNNAQQVLASNDDWENAPNVDEVRRAHAMTGAFPLKAGGRDAALLVTLQPGPYTVQVRGAGSPSGVALAEIYEVDSYTTNELTNISARAQVGSGERVLINGVIVRGVYGSAPKKLLVRAVGPGLQQFNVPGLLANPKLEIVDRNKNVVASNDDWGTGDGVADTRAASAAMKLFTLAEGSRDAACVVSLPPGDYTIVVRGVGETSGVALVEAYAVP